MASTNEAADSKSTANITISMPPLQPSNITVWFALLETQLDAADITTDKLKFATLAKCLDGQLLQQIEGILTNPPAPGRYAKLKEELIRILTDTDSARVNKLVGSKEMGDRKPSQFYQHFRKLASPLPSHIHLMISSSRCGAIDYPPASGVSWPRSTTQTQKN